MKYVYILAAVCLHIYYYFTFKLTATFLYDEKTSFLIH